jgi:hypothetical protein
MKNRTEPELADSELESRIQRFEKMRDALDRKPDANDLAQVFPDEQNHLTVISGWITAQHVCVTSGVHRNVVNRMITANCQHRYIQHGLSRVLAIPESELPRLARLLDDRKQAKAKVENAKAENKTANQAFADFSDDTSWDREWPVLNLPNDQAVRLYIHEWSKRDWSTQPTDPSKPATVFVSDEHLRGKHRKPHSWRVQI